MKLQDKLNEFIPCLCRLLARTGNRWPTSQQLATQSGLTRDRVDSISRLVTWDKVPINEALRFMAACGVDLDDLRRHREFIKRNNWNHWKTAPPRFCGKLLALWIATLRAAKKKV